MKFVSKKNKKSDLGKTNKTKEKEEDVIPVQPPKDWKTEEKLKQIEAKKKAAEVMKKMRGIGPNKKRKIKSSQKRYQIKRQVLNDHRLSESESE